MELQKIDKEDDEIAPYHLDELFDEINYKRNISKEGDIEDGEVSVSSDE